MSAKWKWERKCDASPKDRRLLIVMLRLFLRAETTAKTRASCGPAQPAAAATLLRIPFALFATL